MIIFIRHAERGDNQFPKVLSEIQYDPPIIQKADQTVRKTCQEISQILKKEGIDQVSIVSSKFLRCLMTSQLLAQNLTANGHQVGQSGQIWHQIGQYMRPDWYSEYPLNKIIFDSPHKSKYIKREWKEDKPLKEFSFPQNYVQFHQRVGKVKEGLRFPEKGKCTIIVTHGFVVRELCWRMNQIANYMNEIKYCGYAAYRTDGQKEVLVKAKL